MGKRALVYGESIVNSNAIIHKSNILESQNTLPKKDTAKSGNRVEIETNIFMQQNGVIGVSTEVEIKIDSESVTDTGQRERNAESGEKAKSVEW